MANQSDNKDNWKAADVTPAPTAANASSSLVKVMGGIGFAFVVQFAIIYSVMLAWGWTTWANVVLGIGVVFGVLMLGLTIFAALKLRQ